MDNITHTLVGLLSAEAALIALKKIKNQETQSSTLRRSVFLASVTANNFPDLDFVYAYFMEPKNLQYLLQHRGHTHTFLFAPFGAILVFLGLQFLLRLRKRSLSVIENILVFLVCCAGSFLHIAFDSLNIYGVHPFWPFDGKWYFGDSVFIVEPWFWAFILPLSFFIRRDKFWKIFIGVLAGLSSVLLFLPRFVPWQISVAVVIFGLGLCFLLSRFKASTRVLVSFLLVGILIIFYSLEGRWLKRGIRNSFKNEQAQLILNDVMLTPFPANPFCWTVITLDTYETQASYRLRKGVIAVWPELFSTMRCFKLMYSGQLTAETLEKVSWIQEKSLSLVEFHEILKKSCLARAQMKFLRAPIFRKENGKYLLSDFRFESPSRRNFTQLEIPESNEICPEGIPDWVEPRRDLMEK